MTGRTIAQTLAALAICWPAFAQSPVSVVIAAPSVTDTCRSIMAQFPVVQRCMAMPQPAGANTMAKNVAVWCQTHATMPEWAGGGACERKTAP